MAVSHLLLLSGQDIPFIEGQVIIHPPSLKEWALLGETGLLMAYEAINLTKDKIKVKDKNVLKDKTNFDIFMSALNNNSEELVIKKQKAYITMFFALIFPQYRIQFYPQSIQFLDEAGKVSGEINSNNFEEFKKVISQMLYMKPRSSSEDRPIGAIEQRIMKQLEKRQAKLAELKGKGSEDIEETCIYSHYASILAVGNSIPLDEIMNYTIYQLLDSYTRFILYFQHKQFVQIKLAGGAKDKDEVEDWMKQLHP